MNGYLSSEDTWRGKFWLPDEPDNIQRGIMTYTPDRGVRLTLIGGFDDAEWVPTGQGNTQRLTDRSKAWAVIHGVVNNKPVTLVDCIMSKSTSYWIGSEVAEQEIRAGRAILGVLLKDPSYQGFSGIHIEIENLTEWDYRPDLTFQIKYDENHKYTDWTIHVDPADERTVMVGDLTVSLKRWYTLPKHDVRRGRLQGATSATSTFALSSNSPKSLDEWTAYASVAEDLITFAMDAPSAVLRHRLVPTDELAGDEDAHTRREVFVYENRIIKGDIDAEGVKGSDALFTLGVDGVDYETIVPRWFEVRERFRVACDMILSLVYQSDGYIQSQLITAVAAAEAFHQALELPPPIPDSEFKALKKALKATIPENRRRWLSEKLGRNNPTLRERLLELASRLDEAVMKHLLPSPEGWADAAKDARNNVAHGSDSASQIELLYAVTEVTTAVVIANLLHELAVPIERILYAISSSGRLARAAELSRQHWPAAPNAR